MTKRARIRHLAMLSILSTTLCVTPVMADDCYIEIVPPNNETPFAIGPWKGAHCPDWWGSFLWTHPASCFYGSGDCRANGDGLAYPKDWPCVSGVPRCDDPIPTIPQGAGTDGLNFPTVPYFNLKPGFYALSYEPGMFGVVGRFTDSTDQLESPKCTSYIKKAQRANKLVSRRCFCVGPSPSVCRGPNL